jgi:PPM family protein phosphatase
MTKHYSPPRRADGETSNLRIGAWSDRGGRESNEDHCTSTGLRRAGRDTLGTLVAVADGMGGGEAGKTASSLAIGTLSEAYFESGSDAPLASLQQAVAQANGAVYAFAVNTRKGASVGTTIIAASIVGPRAYLVSVGDSRAYLIRDGQARQITSDHNWATQQVEAGRMSVEQAYAHANAPLLTHVLGQSASLQIPLGGHADSKFSFQLELRPGDGLVLCSDGVAGVVPPQELAELALSAGAERAATAIVARAREHYRTADNATALVIQYAARPRPARNALRWLIPAGGGLSAALAVAAAAFALAGGGNPGMSQTTAVPVPTRREPALITTRVGASPTIKPTNEPTTEQRGPTSTTLPATPTTIPPTPTHTPLPIIPTRAQPEPRKTSTPRPPQVGQPPTALPTAQPIDPSPTAELPTAEPPTAEPPTAEPPTTAPPTLESPIITAVPLPTTPEDDDDDEAPEEPQPPQPELPPVPPQQPEPPAPTDVG